MSPLRENRELEILLPEGWARPSGYSQGVLAKGRYVFVAGQVGWNPITSVFETDDFIGQVKQSLRNIVAVLGTAGAEPRHIVRLTWFITHPNDYRALQSANGDAYAEIIGRPREWTDGAGSLRSCAAGRRAKPAGDFEAAVPRHHPD